ncbi:MAG TPA: hypothetical protein VGQ63_13705 [Pseudolabrys sp.]|jgi:hypothetical protein|nr:hypothetical protein [Pseudolabrys sp.]
MKITVQTGPTPMRHCGGCTLCCKLLPVTDLDKVAGERCRHQRTGKGCAVYNIVGKMPPCCHFWNCRWLVNDDTADLSRPDRAHYVIDLLPDYVTVIDNETGEKTNVEVIQIWCDPKYPDAHRDPALRRYLERRAAEGKMALVRYNQKDAFTIMMFEGKLHEHSADVDVGRGYSLAQVAAALAKP